MLCMQKYRERVPKRTDPDHNTNPDPKPNPKPNPNPNVPNILFNRNSVATYRHRKVLIINQNLDDVVKRLNELDPESEVIPCFVARDLGNLPPITFNSIDVSVLLAKIESMHDEVQLMRAGMTCQQTTAETLKKGM